MSKDRFIMPDGTVLLNVHTQDTCAGQPCCIHNPSNHHMAQWPGDWDNTFKQMWRQCPHGLVHPDPDDLQYLRRMHGDAEAAVAFMHHCDACCLPVAVLPTEISATVSEFLDRPETGTLAARPDRGARLVSHKPDWESADLPINARGDTRPGFICVHVLENGMGQCGGNVFGLEDAIGDHHCWVPEPFVH